MVSVQLFSFRFRDVKRISDLNLSPVSFDSSGFTFREGKQGRLAHVRPPFIKPAS